MVTRCLDRDGISEADSRALVRRTSGDDAKGRWPICLSSRSILAAVGIPLRLDAFPCDSDRYNCSGRCWIRTLQRRACAVGIGEQLHYRADSVWRVRSVTFDSTARRPGAHWIFDIYEHARVGSRQTYTKPFYHRPNWGAICANPAPNHIPL